MNHTLKALFVLFTAAAINGQPVEAQTTIATPNPHVVQLDTTFVKRLFLDQKYTLSGGDGAISFPIDDTNSIFLWGDSFLGEVKNNRRDEDSSPLVCGNVWQLLSDKNVTTRFGGSNDKPEPLLQIENREGRETVLWPMHGFVQNNIIHVFLSAIVRTGTGTWDFYWHSTFYFRLNYPDLTVIDIQEITDSKKSGVHYGFGLLEDEGFYYCYGASPNGVESKLHVARTRLVNDSLQNWEYFDGQNWSKNPMSSQPLHGIDVQVSEQFSVFKKGDKFIFLTQERAANEIYTFVSDRPEGTWGNKKKIFSTPESLLDANQFTYNAMAHPQYKLSDDQLLVSYCVNTNKMSDLFTDASIYRPRFLRVPFALILN